MRVHLLKWYVIHLLFVSRLNESGLKKLLTPKSKTPLDTLRSMSSALCIFMQLTFSSMLHRILTERIIEKMVTTLHGIVKYFVCVLQKVNDFEFT